MTTCIGENEVVDLLDGRLSEADVERITAHLDECGACRELVAAAARDAPVSSSGSEMAGGVTRGTCIGRYVVIDRVGVGAMGVVYAAYDPELDRRVALKLLRTDAFASHKPAAELRARLLREARALAQLSHPNVMTIYDTGTHEGEVFLAMEFARGGTLAEWLAATPSPDATLEMFRQAGEGLAAAHAAGIVHRDFKPQNVVLGEDGRPRVTDFGLAHASGATPGEAPSERPKDEDKDKAKDASNAAPADGPADGPATRTGALVGTPAYMAPEQWKGKPSDARTDVFSFCVALYEALYGERPFAGATADELIDAVARDDVRPARGAVPASVRRVLLRGLRAEPSERYPSMRALLDDLAPPAARGRGAPLAVLLVIAASLVAFGALALRTTPAKVCGGGADEWGDAFDPARADALHAAMTRTAAPTSCATCGEASFATVRGALTHYRGAWLAMHQTACEATRVRGEQSEAILDARMRCLDQRRRGVKAFVHSVETGKGDDLDERATTALANLPRIEDCADLRAIADPVPLPSDVATRSKIEAAANHATEVEASALETHEALATLEPMLAQAKELAWPPLVARIEYDHAMCVSRLRDNRRAEIDLQQAAITAEAAHADALVIDAWTRLVFVVGYQEHRVPEGELWARYAQAAIARAGGDEARQGTLYGNIGIMLLNDENRFEEARANFEHALEIAKRIDGPRSLGVAHGLGRMSLVLFQMARPSEALGYEREGRAVLEQLYGSENVDIAVSLGNEGEELLESGEVDAALPILQRGVAMQERFGRNDSALLGVVARAMRRKGRAAEALELDRRSLAMAEKNEPEGAYELSFGNVGVALDLLELGRVAEALPFAERGAALRTTTWAPSERGEARFVLARVLAAGGGDGAPDTKRARELAQLARIDDAPCAERYGGRYAAALREVDAWLATRP